jgi:predicted DNA-binding transcriptional regulator AlpA
MSTEVIEQRALRRNQVAATLGISERTLERMEARGDAPDGRFKLSESENATVLYERTAFEAWLKRRAGGGDARAA